MSTLQKRVSLDTVNLIKNISLTVTLLIGICVVFVVPHILIKCELATTFGFSEPKTALSSQKLANHKARKEDSLDKITNLEIQITNKDNAVRTLKVENRILQKKIRVLEERTS